MNAAVIRAASATSLSYPSPLPRGEAIGLAALRVTGTAPWSPLAVRSS